MDFLSFLANLLLSVTVDDFRTAVVFDGMSAGKYAFRVISGAGVQRRVAPGPGHDVQTAGAVLPLPAPSRPAVSAVAGVAPPAAAPARRGAGSRAAGSPRPRPDVGHLPGSAARGRDGRVPERFAL